MTPSDMAQALEAHVRAARFRIEAQRLAGDYRQRVHRRIDLPNQRQLDLEESAREAEAEADALAEQHERETLRKAAALLCRGGRLTIGDIVEASVLLASIHSPDAPQEAPCP